MIRIGFTTLSVAAMNGIPKEREKTAHAPEYGRAVR
jgi:hypothetical protein